MRKSTLVQHCDRTKYPTESQADAPLIRIPLCLICLGIDAKIRYIFFPNSALYAKTPQNAEMDSPAQTMSILAGNMMPACPVPPLLGTPVFCIQDGTMIAFAGS
jgi:hypothetical protein